MRNIRPFSFVGLILMACGLLEGCRTAPITGRKQLMILSEVQEMALGQEAFVQVVAEETPSSDPQVIQMVQRVGQRIAQAAQRPDYQWEFRVFASPEMNAFCLPGGKVGVYEGILPVCQTEAGLAVVMSHEIAHAIARHGGERMSQDIAVNSVGNFLAWITSEQSELRRRQVLEAYGMASRFGYILPYSRHHETEADQMGMLLMARAGYDPAEAPRFWQRFAMQQTGPQPPEFMSTHPADERRAADLLAWLPEAQQVYAQAPEKLGLGEPLPIRAPAVLSNAAAPPGGMGGWTVRE